MSEDRRKRAWWPWVIVVLLVLYPMSYGPVLRVCLMHFTATPTAKLIDRVNTAYGPVNFVAGHIGLNKSVATYLRWWCSEELGKREVAK